MAQKNWMSWVFLLALLWICTDTKSSPARQDLTLSRDRIIVGDKFNGCIGFKDMDDANITFLDKVTNTAPGNTVDDYELQMAVRENNSHLLYLWKRSTFIWKGNLHVMYGRKCNLDISDVRCRGNCDFEKENRGNCTVVHLKPKDACEDPTFNLDYCKEMGFENIRMEYIINITYSTKNCISCINPVQKPDEDRELEPISTEEGEGIDPRKASGLMKGMASLAASLNGSKSASMSAGDDVDGILVIQEVEAAAEMEEVLFGISTTSSSMKLIDGRNNLRHCQRSVTVPKEAFEKVYALTNGTPFAAVVRFLNMSKDEKKSSVLGDEVYAIEMGEMIRNLTDNVDISYRNVKEERQGTCHSWNGEGKWPIWTDKGCLTIRSGHNITCRCSHLTFFAVLLSPPNITISASDLSTLTTITYVGCGVSMLFLSMAIFIHCLLRRTQANVATKILIHLMSAMFLLNLTFLTNNWVAKMNNSVGCKIMAAVMHYFMLSTFTWFAVEAFHLCFQLYMAGRITTRHYFLKLSITSWAIPSLVVIVLLIMAEYGEQIIHIDDSATVSDVRMCWILDDHVHYIVNIGYYALVFLVTFTTFIIIMQWLYCLRINKAGRPQKGQSGKGISTILGLCCMLGIGWGFAFFAYGVLRVPSYYIFTILNSFQGFFLFIYYYKQPGETQDSSDKDSSSSSSNTLKTTVAKNPYIDQ
ncbi:adhesion G protein-coupled receptor G3-like [Genypterus blacodes]|uniref:adhesion G protein-coupled receptor G3-like n=1 Tax=Genypterus blacodes TaxID=154954 RepID=UPI003F7579F2